VALIVRRRAKAMKAQSPAHAPAGDSKDREETW
jgi:hypothetical protein